MNKFFKNIKEEANYKIVLFICVFITLYNFVYTNITYDYPIIKKIIIGIFVFITLFSNWLLFKFIINKFNYSKTKNIPLVSILFFFLIFGASAFTSAYFNVIYVFKILSIGRENSFTIFQQTFRIIFALMMIVSFEYTYTYLKEAEQYKLQNMNLLKNNIESRYEMLVEQMNPHFLFNVLSTLRSMVRENDPNTEKFVLAIADLYRYIISRNDRDLVPLSEEIDFLRHYIFMVKQRFEETVEILIDIEQDSINFTIPPFALQIAVENCIKHNVISYISPLIISVYQPRSNVIAIKNIIKEKINKESSSGLGLKNLIERYQILGVEEGVTIIKNGNWFILELKLI